MSGNPKDRLASIFQGGPSDLDGNDALRYTAPREPSRVQAQPSQTPTTTTTTPSTPAAVMYHTTVALYQYDSKTRQYVQKGGGANDGGTDIGCVILGSETTYNLVFYTASKMYLCVVPIKFGSFKPILQAKSYINFYDEKQINWSVKFRNDAQVTEFMKHIFLTKIHIEIWSAQKTITKKDPNSLILDDLLYTKDDLKAVSSGDMVAVNFKCWRVVGNAKCVPNEVITKYAPFELTTNNDLRKFRLGEGNERIKALEEGVNGMRKGGKRMVLAPPGKTNGSDWYLLEIQLVKSKSSSSSSRNNKDTRSSQANTPARRESLDNMTATGSSQDKPRRRSEKPSGDNSMQSGPATTTNDIVPYGIGATPEELELNELRLLKRERELEAQQRALQEQVRASQLAQQQSTGLGGMVFGNSMGLPQTSIGGMSNGFNISPTSLMTSTGRPIEGLINDLHAKIDYLIRMTPTNGSHASSNAMSSIGFPTDVSSVLRGVERLADENERLLVQINSQNQSYQGFEKRCDELLKQNSRLQAEKRAIDEKYQALASQQLNVQSEIAQLSSARTTAMTQLNRLHAEYQQLLTAYHAKQASHSESDEMKTALNFEKSARSRLEKELAQETQGRVLLEKEIALIKRQYEVLSQLKARDTQQHRDELESMITQTKLEAQREAEEQQKRMTLELQQKVAVVEKEKHDEIHQIEIDLKTQVVNLEHKLYEAQMETQELRNQANEAQQQNSMEQPPLELKQQELYEEQLTLLKGQVKKLEAEKLAIMEQNVSTSALNNGSPEASCPQCVELKKRLEKANNSTESTLPKQPSAVAIFKEAVNDMFFRFQDVIDDAVQNQGQTAFEAKQVLSIIRKVLKQSSKQVISRIQSEETKQEDKNVDYTISNPANSENFVPEMPINLPAQDTEMAIEDMDESKPKLDDKENKEEISASPPKASTDESTDESASQSKLSEFLSTVGGSAAPISDGDELKEDVKNGSIKSESTIDEGFLGMFGGIDLPAPSSVAIEDEEKDVEQYVHEDSTDDEFTYAQDDDESMKKVP